MMAEQIASVLEELQNTTDLLFINTNRLDLDQMEVAVAARECAIKRLSELVSNYPNSFTPQHLERVQVLHAKGKQAFEQMVRRRRRGWVTATELQQTEYILKSFSRFGTPPSES